MSAEIHMIDRDTTNLEAWLARLASKLAKKPVDYLFVIVQAEDGDVGIHTFNASIKDATYAAASLSDYAASRRNDFTMVE